MARAVDISMVGDKGLDRMLDKLPDVAQRKVVRKAMRVMAKSLKVEVTNRAPVESGKLQEEMRKVRIKAGKRSRSSVAVVVPLPTREALGIDASSPYFYPAHVEYGHGNVAPKPFIRPAVDENADGEYRKFGDALRKEIPNEAERLAKK